MKQRKRLAGAKPQKNRPSSGASYRSLPGYEDGYGATTPIAYRIADGTPYFDYQLTNEGVSSTARQWTVLYPLLGAGGLLESFPQTALPVRAGTATEFYQQVRITGLLLSVNAKSSESAPALAADLFNRLRALLYWTGETFQSTNNFALTSVDSWPSMLDVEEVLADLQFDLPNVTYNTNDSYSVPMVRTYRCYIPINRVLDCYSGSSTGTANWETRQGDLIFESVSDSLLSPNPTVSLSARVFYHVIRK